MTVEQLIRNYPLLYHMAEDGCLESVFEHGLLSTSALLDLFGTTGEERTAIESRRRSDSFTIRHRRYGAAVIRDQKPMDDDGLRRALPSGITPRQWYEFLNGKVFFWLSRDRLDRLLNARAYRTKRQTVLVVDTEKLVERHLSRVLLSSINSGATKPMPHARSFATFRAVSDYPFEAWKARRGVGDAIVELTVEYAVHDVKELVLRAESVRADSGARVIWRPS